MKLTILGLSIATVSLLFFENKIPFLIGLILFLISIFRSKSSSQNIDTWKLAKIKAGHRCQECGSTHELHVHHIRPIKLGGQDNIENLKVLCKECHELEHGYKIRDDSRKINRSHKSYKIETIGNAIDRKSNIEIVYTKYSGEQVVRKIRPLELYVGENKKQYLKAYDYLRKAERIFRISRIKKINI